ncbi:MAG TPA: PrgI family protein [Candidatus Saccharimonadia bacterium]|nr:PrgI family protein [Candidatus Saccharimonadia bacterium]
MRTTIVPAQVTTIEDRIIGRVSLSQLMLLTVPIFGGSAIFVALPPFFNYATYKVILIVCIAAVCTLLAVRVKGKIIISWLTTLVRYNVRPRYYVFDKNSSYARDVSYEISTAEDTLEAFRPAQNTQPVQLLSPLEHIHIQDIIDSPLVSMHITTNKKGRVYVHLTEISKENVDTSAN